MAKNLISLLLFFFCISIHAQEVFWIGADISGLTEMEQRGIKWYNWKGEERECTALMKELGMNAVRLRVWVDPSAHHNWCNDQDLLVKALRAKTLGMEIMVDFHYSDWWADPAKQNIPKAWEKMSYKKMRRALAAHTRHVLSLLKRNGVSPRWVQVGNETSNGMLWSVETDPLTGWEKKDHNGHTTITKSMGHWERNPQQYAGFIRAGYDAVKEVFPQAIVIVHLDNGFDTELYNKNLDIILSGGGKFDMVGMSLYPYWAMQSGSEPNARKTISDCFRNIRAVKEKYGTDVIIVETGFEVDEQQPWKMEAERQQYADILRRARNETDGACQGVFYWAPECLPGGYKLGAFGSDARPTSIMRALVNDSPYILAPTYDRRMVELQTNYGNIVLELYNETPLHRDNFLSLCSSRQLEGVIFHRVIKDFMIQAGNRAEAEDEDTTTIAAEIVFPQAFHKRGALAAAREGDGDNPTFRSSATQFYIVWGDSPAREGRNPYAPLLPYYSCEEQHPGTPWLDNGYTVFGEVVSGLSVVDSIQHSPTDSGDRPLKNIIITGATILN